MSEARHAQALRHDTESVERFYQCLLSIDCVAEPACFLDTALHLIVEITRSRLVFLELFGDGGIATYCRGHTPTAESVGSIRSKISYGIVRRTERCTIETSSAVHDERFVELASVRQHEIGAVLCAPVGLRLPLGVIYMQSTAAYSTLDRQRVECLATRVARIAPRLTQSSTLRRPLADEIRELQERRVCEAMDRHDGNIAEVARELGVGRAFVYTVLQRLADLRGVSGGSTNAE
jgi:hypothetical protein